MVLFDIVVAVVVNGYRVKLSDTVKTAAIIFTIRVIFQWKNFFVEVVHAIALSLKKKRTYIFLFETEVNVSKHSRLFKQQTF